jgi:hypothetical protein
MDIIGVASWLQPSITLFVGIVGAGIAVRAWLTSVAALHSAYRPVLRPVPARNNPELLLIKNVGRGPAVSIVLMEKNHPQVIAELDLVEPLGPRPSGRDGEVQRVGRRELRLAGSGLTPGRSYRLVYQDIAGRWHETLFLNKQDLTFSVRYLGPQWSWRIPSDIRSMGQVTKNSEFD